MTFALLAVIVGSLVPWQPAAAGGEPGKAPAVVVTIKPLHALVAEVMAGVGEPQLLVKGQGSPHTYALKPSEARALNNADLFFRMSDAVEPFTAKIVKTLPASVEVVTLQEAPGLELLTRRTHASFERHAQGGAHAHDHDGAANQSSAGMIDGHAWLDPVNAKKLVDRIETALSARDAAHATTYHANAVLLRGKLDALASELDAHLKPLTGKPYVVFHDAFQYFERRYGLNAVGSVSISPELPPSAKRLSELRQKIVSLGATCVFAEPQFEPRLVSNLIEGTQARTATLDPEGGALEPGPEMYFILMRKLAQDLRACLAPPA